MHTSLPSLAMIAFAAINALIALDMSGEAGHGLEAELGEYAVHLYHTSAKYHMWHVFALIGTAILHDLWTDRWSRLCLKFAGLGFALGIVLFCGGYYRLPAGRVSNPGHRRRGFVHGRLGCLWPVDCDPIFGNAGGGGQRDGGLRVSRLP